MSRLSNVVSRSDRSKLNEYLLPPAIRALAAWDSNIQDLLPAVFCLGKCKIFFSLSDDPAENSLPSKGSGEMQRSSGSALRTILGDLGEKSPQMMS